MRNTEKAGNGEETPTVDCRFELAHFASDLDVDHLRQVASGNSSCDLGDTSLRMWCHNQNRLSPSM